MSCNIVAMSCKTQYKPSFVIRFVIIVIGLLLVLSSHMILSVLSIGVENSPQNTVLLAGSVFRIAYCNVSNYLTLKSAPEASQSTIYNGRKLAAEYELRVSVSNVSTHSGRALILISDINSEDAGVYECSDPSRSSNTSLLIVISSQPACHYDIQVDDTNNTANISCTVNYSGYWQPSIEWTTSAHTNISTILTKHTGLNNNIILTSVTTVERTDLYTEIEKYYCNTFFESDNRPSGTHVANVPEYNFTCELEIKWQKVMITNYETTADPISSHTDTNSISRSHSDHLMTSPSSSSNEGGSSPSADSSSYWTILGAVIGVVTLIVFVAFAITVLVILMQQRKKATLAPHVCIRTAEKSTSLARSGELFNFRNQRQRISSFMSQLTRSSANCDESEYAEIVSRRCTLATRSTVEMEPGAVSLSNNAAGHLAANYSKRRNADNSTTTAKMPTNKAVYAQVNKNRSNRNVKADVSNTVNVPDVVGSQVTFSRPTSQCSEYDEVSYHLKPPKEIYDTCPLDNRQCCDNSDVGEYASVDNYAM